MSHTASGRVALPILFLGLLGHHAAAQGRWRWESPALVPTNTLVPGEKRPGLAYDPASGNVWMWSPGGNRWLHELSRDAAGNYAWTREPIPSPPALWPPAINGTRMVYDPTTTELILVGGQLFGNQRTGTWAFDLTSRTWSQRSVSSRLAGSSPSRLSHDP